jgi:hypothetical protein
VKGDPAAHRADEEDPPASGAQQGKKGLGDGHLPDDVDVKDVTQIPRGHGLQGSADGDPGVVDERVEGAACLFLDLRPRRLDRACVGDVESHRRDVPGLGFDRSRVGVVAHSGENPPAIPGQAGAAGPADPRRATADQNASHIDSPSGWLRLTDLPALLRSEQILPGVVFAPLSPG